MQLVVVRNKVRIILEWLTRRFSCAITYKLGLFDYAVNVSGIL